MTRTLRHPDLAPAHPGALVAEIMEDQKGNKTHLAEALGVTRAALYNVLDEKSAISAAMAVRIEGALGISADLLVNMQAAHDLWRARQTKPKRGRPMPILGIKRPADGLEVFAIAKGGQRVVRSASSGRFASKASAAKPKTRKSK